MDALQPPGPFALFSASPFIGDYAICVKVYSQATWGQIFVASPTRTIASHRRCASDAVGAHIQQANFEKASGLTIVKDLGKDYGLMAPLRDLTPRVRQVALTYVEPVLKCVADPC